MGRAALILAAVALVAAAWLLRYSMVATQSGETSRAYVLDRWTGRFFVITPSGMAPIEIFD